MGSCSSKSTGSSVWKLLTAFKGPWALLGLLALENDPRLGRKVRVGRLEGREMEQSSRGGWRRFVALMRWTWFVRKYEWPPSARLRSIYVILMVPLGSPCLSLEVGDPTYVCRHNKANSQPRGEIPTFLSGNELASTAPHPPLTA